VASLPHAQDLFGGLFFINKAATKINMSEKVTSATGAYMSQYDQEVEARLKSLEETVGKLQEENAQLKKQVKSRSAKGADAPTASADLENRVKVLEYVARATEPNFDKLASKA
jgi:uncharacterized protein YlxW (UPF0749 family)